LTEKFEDSQFKFLLSELKKVKKEVIKSYNDPDEEPKRLKEDFSVIRNNEEFTRQQFKQMFEQG